jgi:hypothetical protein
MNAQKGIIMWVLGTVGVLLLYTAYRNVTLPSFIGHYLNASIPFEPIDPQSSSLATPTGPVTEGRRSRGGSFAPIGSATGALIGSGLPTGITDGATLGGLPAGYGTSPGTYIPTKAVMK